MNGDFSAVTESPGLPASRLQLARAVHRYSLAARYVEGLDVLEVACGTGIGLSALARSATSVVGVDVTPGNLDIARRYSRDDFDLRLASADALPFSAGAFDAVVFLEALYYVRSPEQVIQEFVRVLRRPGRVFISTVNPSWPEFVPSALSTQYLNSTELAYLLGKWGFCVEVYGSFPSARSLRASGIATIRRAARALHVVPATLGARTILKRLFYGRLEPMPSELPSVQAAEGVNLTRLDPAVIDRFHSILYAFGQLS